MSITPWTIGDLAELTQLAVQLAIVEGDNYCEHCTVVPVIPGDKYCAGCANDICESLAAAYVEQAAVEAGLY